MNRYPFQVPVGDFSGDGHGLCSYFPASAAKPIEEVREAYFSAKEKFPELLCPEEMFKNYEENQLNPDVFSMLETYNAPPPPRWDTDEEPEQEADEWLVSYVIWFINQGDSTIDAKQEPYVPSLSFYGFDEKKRHIRFIGYGLFSR